MKISFYDPFISEEISSFDEFQKVDFHELCNYSDFVVLACSLTKENKHLINKTSLSLMKKNPIIINVSRGSLINEIDLIQALKDKKIRGVGLDVFENEPLPINSELLNFENTIFGSHNSSNTIEAVERVNNMTIEMVVELSREKDYLDKYKDKIIV